MSTYDFVIVFRKEGGKKLLNEKEFENIAISDLLLIFDDKDTLSKDFIERNKGDFYRVPVKQLSYSDGIIFWSILDIYGDEGREAFYDMQYCKYISVIFKLNNKTFEVCINNREDFKLNTYDQNKYLNEFYKIIY